MIGNAIRMMARAPKSRAGCHFGAAIGLRSMLENFAPTIPDLANDQHTLAGKKLARGLEHFRKEGAKLIPEPTASDPYIEEAYRLWQIKQQSSDHARRWQQRHALHASDAQRNGQAVMAHVLSPTLPTCGRLLTPGDIAIEAGDTAERLDGYHQARWDRRSR
jgi:hypothetical protein